MPRSPKVFAFAALATLGNWGTAPVAHATSNRVPSTLAQRDLVVPARTVLIDGGPRWIVPEGQFVYRLNDYGDNPAWINAGATFGLTRDFQLGAVVPTRVAPDGPDLHDPRVHLLYQFARGTADVGIFVQGNLPFEGDPYFVTGLPIQVHLGGVARLDTGPFFRTGFSDDDAYADFSIPFLLPINITSQFFLGPEVALWTEGEFDYVRVPGGFFLGYTIQSGGGTVGDLSFRFRDHNLRDSGNVVDLIFAVDIFFDL